MELYCGFCNYVAAGNADLVNHVKRKHRHHPKFKVTCSYPLCNFTSKSWSSFKVHMSKKHSRNLQQITVVDGEDSDEADYQGNDVPPPPLTQKFQLE